MKDKLKSTTGERSGQSLVELAISLMVILMLLLGAVEFSLALFQYVTIRDAAQEGAVYGSFTPGDLAGVRYRVAAAASDVMVIDPNEPMVSAVINGRPCEKSGETNTITVTVKYPHVIAFPLVGPMIGTNTINLTASVTNTILSPSCE